MTRKRFVKLLMACGWSRDRAQALAGNVAAGGYSYAAEMQDLVDFYRLFAEFRLALNVMERRLVHARGLAAVRGDRRLYEALADASRALGWLYKLTWALDNLPND